MQFNQWYVPLTDHKISLIPLTEEHIHASRRLSGDEDIWRWYIENLTDPDTLEQWMRDRLKEAEEGTQMVYAVVLNKTGEVIGSTSFGNIDWTEHCVEIGWSWLGREFIGTGLNKHMKYLMLQHAFDQMGMERVELRTDEQNLRSRRAMEKIGAKYEGMLRNHRSTQGNRRRNTVIYSIIRSEWPQVKSSIFSPW